MGRIAVLTGDVVASTGLPTGALKTVLDEIAQAFATMQSWEPGIRGVGPDIFRGDSWQVALDNPRWALRAAVHVRARLIARGVADTRIGIGIGGFEGALSQPVSHLSGEAFMLSGQALDGIGKKRLALAAPDTGDDTTAFAATIVELCDTFVSGWTSRQAEFVAQAMRPDNPTLETIGKNAAGDATVQAVSQHLKRAHWPVLKHALTTLESSKWLK